MKLLWEERAWEDYLYWQQQNKKMLKKVNLLLKDIQRDCYNGIGKPETLKENLMGWWSRRIDNENRKVYSKKGENIIIAACKGHYE